VISLQREVARAIAAEVDAQLTASERDRLADTDRVHPEAYDAYLKGRSHWYRFLPGDADRAARYFERALELDPDFALAYTGLADVWGWRAHWGLLPPSEVSPRLGGLTRKVLQLDPDHARTQATLGKTRLYVEHDWEGAEAAFDRALELGPNDTDIHWENAVFLCAMGRAEEALAKARRGIEHDPLNSFGELVEGLAFWNCEPARIEEAVEGLRRALPLLPARLALWNIYAATGRHERALAEATGFYESVDDRRTVQALEEDWRDGATGGDAGAAYRAAMRAGGQALETRAVDDYVQPSQVARFWLQAGEPARTLDWLECALEERDFYVVYLDLAEWHDLRSEPRFDEILDRLGLPAD